MYFVSSRRDLDDEDHIADAETCWNVAIDEGIETDRIRIELDTLLSEVDGQSILLLVHGYNNEFGAIVHAYDLIDRKVQQHLGDHYDLVIGYVWPGGDAVSDWDDAKRRADRVAPRLALALRQLSQYANQLDLMSHSLGARVSLKAIHLAGEGHAHIHYLTASAIDNEWIEHGERFFPATQRTAWNFVLHSRNDTVLDWGYYLAEWDNALGWKGPEHPSEIVEHSPNVYVVNCRYVVFEHGGYKGCDAMYGFMHRVLEDEEINQFELLRPV